MTRRLVVHAAAVSALSIAGCAAIAQGPAQPVAEIGSAAPGSYADVARWAADAPAIVELSVRRAEALPQTALPGRVRAAIEADVVAVRFAAVPVAQRVRLIADVPADPRGRMVRLNRARFFAFATTPARADVLQLVAPDALMPADPATDATLSAILAERTSGPVPPVVTGITQAFHTQGTVAGESETQLFLRTADGAPVSLGVVRRPGLAPAWSVAFGEVIDEAARAPERRTIAWYRLACGLPDIVPDAAMVDLGPAERSAVAADYALVRSALGPCDASR